MGSTRLPGKVLMDLAGKKVLYHVIDRVLRSKLIDKVVIATTTEEKDDAIVEACEGYDERVTTSRGSENDVLDRYYQAAVQEKANVIIRVTSDCPVIDHEILDRIIQKYLDTGVDYVSNFFNVRMFPRGLDAEVFSFAALEKAHKEAQSQEEREHVTPYIWRNPDIYKCGSFPNDVDLSQHRWTLDEDDDYKLLKEIYDNLYEEKEDFLLKDILELIERKPELAKINTHVEQKKI